MMKKMFLLAILAFAVLLIPACQQQGKTTVGPTFVGGDKGLSMEFVKDAPPAEIFDGGKFPFSVNVKMKNVGEWQIPSGAQIRATISGVDPADYGVSAAALQKNPPQGMLSTRRGPGGEVIEGDTIVVDFAGLNYKRTLFGDVPATFKADACYQYGTKVSTSICIKKDLSSSDTSVCVVNEEKAVANSGAPIHLSSMRESQGGTDAVLLTFTLNHVGTGKFFEKGSQCQDDIQKREKVYVKIDTGMTGLQCTGLQTSTGQPATGSEGYLVLFGGERQFTCTQPTGGQGDFVKTLTATVEYDYQDFITKEITVKHI
jgi:hypothetical protein